MSSSSSHSHLYLTLFLKLWDESNSKSRLSLAEHFISLLEGCEKLPKDHFDHSYLYNSTAVCFPSSAVFPFSSSVSAPSSISSDNRSGKSLASYGKPPSVALKNLYDGKTYPPIAVYIRGVVLRPPAARLQLSGRHRTVLLLRLCACLRLLPYPNCEAPSESESPPNPPHLPLLAVPVLQICIHLLTSSTGVFPPNPPPALAAAPAFAPPSLSSLSSPEVLEEFLSSSVGLESLLAAGHAAQACARRLQTLLLEALSAPPFADSAATFASLSAAAQPCVEVLLQTFSLLKHIAVQSRASKEMLCRAGVLSLLSSSLSSCGSFLTSSSEDDMTNPEIDRNNANFSGDDPSSAQETAVTPNHVLLSRFFDCACRSLILELAVANPLYLPSVKSVLLSIMSSTDHQSAMSARRLAVQVSAEIMSPLGPFYTVGFDPSSLPFIPEAVRCLDSVDVMLQHESLHLLQTLADLPGAAAPIAVAVAKALHDSTSSTNKPVLCNVVSVLGREHAAVLLSFGIVEELLNVIVNQVHAQDVYIAAGKAIGCSEEMQSRARLYVKSPEHQSRLADVLAVGPECAGTFIDSLLADTKAIEFIRQRLTSKPPSKKRGGGEEGRGDVGGAFFVTDEVATFNPGYSQSRWEEENDEDDDNDDEPLFLWGTQRQALTDPLPSIPPLNLSRVLGGGSSSPLQSGARNPKSSARRTKVPPPAFKAGDVPPYRAAMEVMIRASMPGQDGRSYEPAPARPPPVPTKPTNEKNGRRWKSSEMTSVKVASPRLHHAVMKVSEGEKKGKVSPRRAAGYAAPAANPATGAFLSIGNGGGSGAAEVRPSLGVAAKKKKPAIKAWEDDGKRKPLASPPVSSGVAGVVGSKLAEGGVSFDFAEMYAVDISTPVGGDTLVRNWDHDSRSSPGAFNGATPASLRSE